jgi:disulfide bond formation protein DsbB
VQTAAASQLGRMILAVAADALRGLGGRRSAPAGTRPVIEPASMDEADQRPDDARRRGWPLLVGCWVVATAASLGSLFFSEIMELPPCSLCWYQRVFMFPLAVVLLVGVLTDDPRCTRYALPLAAAGWLVAAYHVLLQAGVIPEGAAPCQRGVSCAEVDFALFGVLSIPVLALVAFTALVAGLWMVRRSSPP